MNQPLHLIVAAVLSSLTAGAATATAEPDYYLSYSGTAIAHRSHQFLYHENHVLHYRDGKIADRVVLYTCSDGSPFARKTVSYRNPLAPDFQLEDASNGMREGVRTAGSELEIYFRPNRAAGEKTGELPSIPGLVADAGFDEFVRTNWQALLAGKELNMRFLVPSRVSTMSFQVHHLRSDELNGMPVEVFRLTLSGILGWVLPGIDVYYGAKDQVLMRYVGLSDLRDRGNNNFQAQIDFRPGDRKPVDEQHIANAERARLAPCS